MLPAFWPTEQGMTHRISSHPSAWQRARARQPSRWLRWASRVEAWPARGWLALQLAALLPIVLGQLQQQAVHLALAAPVGVAWLLGLAALCFAGHRPHWSARQHWLLAAALTTLLAAVLAAVSPRLASATSPGWLVTMAWLSLAACGCARTAFTGAPHNSPPWPVGRIAHPTRRFAHAALQRLQRAAAGKCAYAAVLVTSGVGAALTLVGS